MAKLERITTPLGTLTYPCFIDEPDTNFRDQANENDLGDYKARLRLTPEEAAPLVGHLQQIFDEFLQTKQLEVGKKKIKVGEDALPWYPELDRETGEETGMVIFRAKMKRRIVRAKDQRIFDQAPRVFDAQGTPIKEVPQIGYGSKAKLNISPSGWYNGGKGAGLTLYLNAVQLIELTERGSSTTASDYGFGEEEGSYEVGSFDGASSTPQTADADGDF